MSDFRTVQDYMEYQEETAIPKLRWLQVKTLKEEQKKPLTSLVLRRGGGGSFYLLFWNLHKI